MNDERHLAEVAAHLRIAFDLFETGVEMRRQQLRRAHPGLVDSEIEELVAAWRPEIVDRADTLDVFAGLRVPVARTGHLALKLLSRDARTRPQDQIDLVELRRAATEADIDEARGAVAMIHARGFQRDRDLVRDLERLVAEGI